MPIRLPTLCIIKTFADGRYTLSNRRLPRVICRPCRRPCRPQCTPVYDHLPRHPKVRPAAQVLSRASAPRALRQLHFEILFTVLDLVHRLYNMEYDVVDLDFRGLHVDLI